MSAIPSNLLITKFKLNPKNPFPNQAHRNNVISYDLTLAKKSFIAPILKCSMIYNEQLRRDAISAVLDPIMNKRDDLIRAAAFIYFDGDEAAASEALADKYLKNEITGTISRTTSIFDTVLDSFKPINALEPYKKYTIRDALISILPFGASENPPYPPQDPLNEIITYDLSGLSAHSVIHSLLMALNIQRDYQLQGAVDEEKLVRNIIKIHVQRVRERYFMGGFDVAKPDNPNLISFADITNSYNIIPFIRQFPENQYSPLDKISPYPFEKFTVRDIRNTLSITIQPKYKLSIDAALRDYAEPKDSSGQIVDINLLTSMSDPVPVGVVYYMTEESAAVMFVILKLISILLIITITALIIRFERRKNGKKESTARTN